MKHHIQLTYNPFLTENKAIFKIDGVEQERDYRHLNLQSWISDFFNTESERLEGCKLFDFEFTGLEVDCRDMSEIVERATKSQGFDINFKVNAIPFSASERLEKLEILLEDMKGDPIFKEKMEKHNSFKTLEEKVFDVLVIATMSAGKSTFINTMLGCDLLPAHKKATTAGITEILHNPVLKQGEFIVSRKNINGEYLDKNIQLDLTKPEKAQEAKGLIASWNKEIDNEEISEDKRTATIHLEGNLINIDVPYKLKLRLSDTPGPNSANKLRHSDIMFKKVKDTQNNPLIVYLLNSENPEANDDDKLLKAISKEMKSKGKLASDRFMFVLSKMDECFTDDEDINQTIIDMKDYLIRHGIKNPEIYPITAELAKLARIEELDIKLLSENQKLRLDGLKKCILSEERFDLSRYMPMRTDLRDLEDSLLKRSGIPAVEMAISNYIKKYNEPYRIMQMIKAMEEIISEIKANVDTDIYLKGKSLDELNELAKGLKNVQDKLKKSNYIEQRIDELKKDEEGLDNEIANFFNAKSSAISSEIAKYQEKLNKQEDELSLDEANKLMSELAQELNYLIFDLRAGVENLDSELQTKTLERLNDEFEKIVSDHFDDLFDNLSDTEIMKNISIQTINLQHYLHLDDVEIYEEEKIVGKRKKSVWEKIKGFFKLDFSDYEYIKRNFKFVDISKFKEKIISIDVNFSNEIYRLSDNLKQNAANLTENYCKQLEQNLKKELKKILEDTQNKIAIKIDEKGEVLENIVKSIEALNSKLNYFIEQLERNKHLQGA
ncbi:hypothetical protein BKG94_05595 [Rodentibacter ratti]|uniref:dynamin family protein n=1 Tax=Rodentibacter ratti TaxID=1906745 RepID=UPI000986BF5A|nr:dynamin family protein [Rodentibacter ratti]OOF88615.1 hypothetical protein BKG94_05595 [Rodentibacter ratti]